MRPLSVLMEERYRYRQTIARHSTLDSVDAEGRLDMVVPYDGHDHFTREAVDDVDDRIADLDAEGDIQAVIGHLVVVDHQDTDLADVLRLDGRFGAHRLEIPVRSEELAKTGDLSADRYVYSSSIGYRPDPGRPKLVPLQLDVRLSDPDNVDGSIPQDIWKAATGVDGARYGSTADAIKRSVGFRPFLRLAVTARITLPAGPAGPDESQPIVRRVSVQLPSVLSLSPSSLALKVGARAGYPLQYHPSGSRLEWFDVPTMPDGVHANQAPRRFASPTMALQFQHPGELFAAPTLEVAVEVEVPDELLSGTQARLFDACGHRVPPATSPLRTRSVICTTCTVNLDHSFAGRQVSPFQSFHFDEVVPDALRFADIHAALVDQRFSVREIELGDDTAPAVIRRLIVAEREDGPDVLQLLVLVEGRRHSTRREAHSPGGNRHTTRFDSGDLTVFVRGQVRRDARTAVHEINALQLALRARFDRLRAPR